MIGVSRRTISNYCEEGGFEFSEQVRRAERRAGVSVRKSRAGFHRNQFHYLDYEYYKEGPKGLKIDLYNHHRQNKQNHNQDID